MYKDQLIDSFSQRKSQRNANSRFESPDNNLSLFEQVKNYQRSRNSRIRSNSVSFSEYNNNGSNSPTYLDRRIMNNAYALVSSGSGHSNRSQHNPITNPIGDSPIRPIKRPLFKPHTLIAY